MSLVQSIEQSRIPEQMFDIAMMENGRLHPQ